MRELEARLDAIQQERGGAANAPAAPQRWIAPQGGAGQGGAQGGGRGGARGGQQVFGIQNTPQGVHIAPSGARVIEVHPALPGGDPDCSPSRVRVQGLPGGQGAIVIEVPTIDGMQLATIDPQWAEELAEWAEEFAEEQAEAWEAAQEAWEEDMELWEEQMEEHFEAFEDFEEFDSFDDCEEVECEDSVDETEEEPAEIVRSLFQPMREFGARLASDAGDSSLFRVASNNPFSSETLRSAIDELRGEVDGVRSALRDLKLRIQELRGVEPR